MLSCASWTVQCQMRHLVQANINPTNVLSKIASSHPFSLTEVSLLSLDLRTALIRLVILLSPCLLGQPHYSNKWHSLGCCLMRTGNNSDFLHTTLWHQPCVLPDSGHFILIMHWQCMQFDCFCHLIWCIIAYFSPRMHRILSDLCNVNYYIIMLSVPMVKTVMDDH